MPSSISTLSVRPRPRRCALQSHPPCSLRSCIADPVAARTLLPLADSGDGRVRPLPQDETQPDAQHRGGAGGSRCPVSISDGGEDAKGAGLGSGGSGEGKGFRVEEGSRWTHPGGSWRKGSDEQEQRSTYRSNRCVRLLCWWRMRIAPDCSSLSIFQGPARHCSSRLSLERCPSPLRRSTQRLSRRQDVRLAAVRPISASQRS